MHREPPFNPLDKKNLGTSVADALLESPRRPLPPREKFVAAGVYAIYYKGDFPLYRRLADPNKKGKGRKDVPIYVGKAIPSGGRKGGPIDEISPGTVLYNRLAEHADSIKEVENLQIHDFFCRYLAVDDIWIPLGESLLIRKFNPLWNVALDGYGNHDPGKGRYQQQISPWDVLHPGRSWAKKLQPGKSQDIIAEMIRQHIHPLKK